MEEWVQLKAELDALRGQHRELLLQEREREKANAMAHHRYEEINTICLLTCTPPLSVRYVPRLLIGVICPSFSALSSRGASPGAMAAREDFERQLKQQARDLAQDVDSGEAKPGRVDSAVGPDAPGDADLGVHAMELAPRPFTKDSIGGKGYRRR